MVGKEVNIEIQNKYTNPEEPGSFASLKTFKENQPYRGRQVSQALKKVETFARHIPVRKKFKKYNTNVCRLDDTWQIDLIDVSKFNNKKYAQAFNYVFICIDVFSKYVWACPMKEKEAIQSKECFEHILNTSKRKPKAVYHDSGNEFKGEFARYLQDNSIEQYFSNIRYKYKAGTVERFNRTLKERIWRYFTYSKNTNYIKVLDKLVSSYNNTFHSSLKTRSDKTKKVKLTSKEIINEFKKNKIKFTSKDIIKKLKEGKFKTIKDKTIIKRYTPSQISDNPKLAEEIASEREENQLLSTFNNPLQFKFKKGNYVRTSVVKTIFEKGYVPNWSEEVYCISTLIASIPPRYKLTTIQKGQKPAELEYLFYEEELQRVPDNEFPYDTFVVREYDNDNYLVTKLNDKDQEEESIVSKKEFHKDEIQENPQKENLTIETIDKVPKKRGRKTRAEKALLKENEPKSEIAQEGIQTRTRSKAKIT